MILNERVVNSPSALRCVHWATLDLSCHHCDREVELHAEIQNAKQSLRTEIERLAKERDALEADLSHASVEIEALRVRFESTAERLLIRSAEVEQLSAALRQIAEFDAAARHGYIDEWEEAAAFEACQKIAASALAAKQ